MANPFLMGDLDAGDTQVTSTTPSFNPFLSGTMDFSASESENPFMSTLSTEATSTNPFAFGGTDNASITTDFFSSSAPEVDKTQHHQTQSYENVFSSPVSNHTSNGISSDIFSGFIDQQPQYQPQTTFSAFGSARSSVDHTAFVNNNVSLFGCDPLSMTNSREGSGASTPKGAPPKRPPPPPGLPQRPGPPKETMNLILSVTGTMEATSSQMLDRLQATRTPSPTPMRDLNTPSPTPDMFGDLLGADDVPPIHTEPQQPVQEVNLLGDMEYDLVSSSTAMQPTQMVPIAPVPSSVSQVTPVIPTAKITSVAAPPPRPLPPRPGPPPERPAPPPERPSLPPERPVLPPERPKPPPTIPTDPSVQNNIIDWNEPKPQPIPKHTEVPTRYVSPSSEPHKSEDITSSLSTKLAFSEPSEEELDFSLAVSTGPSNEPTIIHGPVESTPFITSGFESSTQPTFDTPVFDSHVNEAALVAYPSQLTLTEPIDTSEPALPSTGFEAPESEATYTSQFDQQGNVEDSSFATGFASEMNISVVPASADNSIDSSVFGVTSTEMSDSFFSNTDVLFTAQSNDLFAPPETVLHTTPVVPTQPFNVFGDSGAQQADEFDAFTAKFESAGFEDNKNTSSGAFDPFSSSPFGAPKIKEDTSMGFGADDNFDSFLATQEPPPVPQSTPARLGRGGSADSDDSKDFNVFIKPAGERGLTPDFGGGVPSLAPPPKSPLNAFQDSSPRFNPFDKSQEVPAQLADNIFAQAAVLPDEGDKPLERTDSQETPPTPLFDEDVSQPLEPFPRIHYSGLGWEMHLRHPNKKKITGQRFWKKVFIRLVYQGENPVLQLLNNKDDKDPFQELPLQPCYSVSDIGAQQFDQYGKIFTVKLQFIFYKERPGVRPGQVTKAERITNKLSQFAAYAIQGDYQGVKEFGSDLKKLGLPVEHAPQISQLFKIGSQSYEDMKQFSVCIEEALFRLPAHRDRALNYKMEEVQITAVDELYVDQNATGGIIRQIARVRLFFLGFLSGMPDVELGVNDMVRQGKEVVGRHDIIPVVTEEWIRLEAVEFHSCVQQDEYERTRTIKFKPPDASYIELMRFRVRPPRNRELPLQLRVQMCISGNKVDLNADVLVPGFSSRKLGQIPCEDVAVRIPIPECWIYLFRVEKHFRYGSVKSAHRRTGKVKGLERFLGTVENMEPQLMEATSGQAKYEHQHRAIVWRMPRLPKEGQGAYTTHNLVCHMALTSFDQIPEELEKFCYVEFTMPVTQVSHTTARSVSISDTDNDSPPEKYVRQLARHEYKVEIEFTQREGPNDYIAATKPVAPPPIAEEPPPRPPAAPDSDSDSSG